ncbi:hypothetical protein [Frigoriglobus tundricola]|uniref:Protein SirB1 N-terminal domain-containing protein n=1 Tax=Frigoriglobus tundricola TaxID=2774151 RepID=A0A6M5YWN7_9BACT|nr:hypothetical protein [Frigoriglobus tundricola]QJW98445.1 hypothetical protein FTUN_6035 [Frigoriglobus tundricola]
MAQQASVPHWRRLVHLPDEALAGCDIAAVNLACAEGLPGAEQIDHSYCLYKLDDWADMVKEYTTLLMPQFRRKPKEYENSEAFFRTLSLITVLQRDCGVLYNPAKIPDDAPFDTADTFIHGIIQGDGGTCATMPVVYAAVGRRLGYPIKLVSTRSKMAGHLFARWDDPTTGERFNIEAAGHGLSTPSDDYYRKGPGARYDLPPGAEEDGGYLRSKTPRMELASFLSNRAFRWESLGDWWRCVDAWAWASSLVPDSRIVRNSLKTSMVQWDKEQRARKPVGFPHLLVRAIKRQFPESLPLELEQDICGLTATHNMLSDPRLEEKYWKPMRNGVCQRMPYQAVADFAPDTSFLINLHFYA